MEIETLILGAGAAGLMCAAHCGPSTLLIDHARRPGEKIRISGGGRCNFTNLDVTAANFHGENPHFCKSALARYSQWDFISLMSEHGIAWHEKTLGQLFCDGKATQIVDMLTGLVARAGASLQLETSLAALSHDGSHFIATLARGNGRQSVRARNLVVATGGKSIPRMGATGLAYYIATQFGLSLTPTRPALVPFTFPDGRFAPLSGTALPVRASTNDISFDEALLFTHRGLSGPAILQISSFWQPGTPIRIDLLPGTPLFDKVLDTFPGLQDADMFDMADLQSRLFQTDLYNLNDFGNDVTTFMEAIDTTALEMCQLVLDAGGGAAGYGHGTGKTILQGNELPYPSR